MSDSRRQPRKRPINYLEIYNCDTGKFLGNVVDITEDGLRVYSERVVIPGRTYSVRLTSAQFTDAREEIRFDAVCRWCKECTGHLLQGSFAAGFEITRLSVEDSELLHKLLGSSWFRDWRQLPDYEAIRRETGFPQK
jgi:hypothetical protein